MPDTLEDALLKQYSPTALIHGSEVSLPASVQWVRERTALGQGTTMLAGYSASNRPFPRDVRRGSRDPKDWVMYGHAFPKEGGGIVLQYWFYFPYNAGPMVFFDHESDWEHVSVELDANQRPQQFILARHDDNAPGVRVPWSAVPKEGDHPFFLVAWGSHASYLRHKDAPWWERVKDCPRRADGTPILDHCPVIVWRAGGDLNRPSPIVNVGERGAPRLDADKDGFFMRYSGLWGDPAVRKIYSAAPPGPPMQAGFCSDAVTGTCG